MRYDYGIDWLLTGTPRPAQIEALARSYTGVAYQDTLASEIVRRDLPHVGKPARGWGHWCQMRVGKTPTALNEFMLFKRDYNFRKFLIFSPNKFKFTWQREAARFGIDVPVYVHDRDKKALASWLSKNSEGMVVVNYEALIQSEVVEALMKWVDRKTYIGADESVKLKNPDSTFFKRGLDIRKQAGAARTLTGKPAPQGPQDYYAQLRFGGALEGLNKHAWKARHCQTGGFKGKQVTGIKNPERLATTLFENVFIAQRRDWADWIESDYNTVELDMLPNQQRAYTEMEVDFVTWLNEHQSVSVEMAANKYAKLQQISSGFIYDEFGAYHELVPFETTPKFLDLVEHIEERAIDKVLIAYMHKPVGELLMKHLAKYNPAIIAGSEFMRKLGRDVEAEKDRFNNDPNCRIMLGQETAVKYGFTLMGSDDHPCLDLVFYENTYSLDDRSQTEERPQGQGQVSALQILDYTASPVEARIIAALQRKESVSQLIVDHYRQIAASVRSRR